MELVSVNGKMSQLDQYVQSVEMSSDVNFMQANTNPVDLFMLRNDCIIPSFAKDNETTISHAEFIDVVSECAHQVFKHETILNPAVRVSHPIKGRIPSAMGKPAKELSEYEKTLYYERMAFIIEIPSINSEVNGNGVSLTVGGVRAYNLDNLHGRKTMERFKIFIGFKNLVCTNLCVSTDGFLDSMKVSALSDMAVKTLELFSQFKVDHALNAFSLLNEHSLTEHQFAQLIGKMKLYQYLPSSQRKDLDLVPVNDSQIGIIAKDYYKDLSFCKSESGEINLWKVYNLFTGANKSSYIDTFLDRDVGCLLFVEMLKKALNKPEECWFLT